ncbi:TPA: non-oxidative hydroxyarylic acid decarboxylases subunit D [Klebsiella pneumoniae]
MICPRCADEKIEVMATSPVKGVWTVYQCQHCLYTWRDTEPQVPHVPPLLPEDKR